jgi:uncharacterized membrane protein YedE/YeeE
MGANAIKAESSTAIMWKKKVPLLTNLFIMKDMVLVLGIACGVLLAFLLLISGGEDLDQIIQVWALVCAIIGGLLVVSCLIVFFNRMNMEFSVGPEGVLMAVGSKERKIDSAVAIIGMLTGNIRVAGAGLLAKSNEALLAEWPKIKKVTIYRNQKVIALKIGLLTPMRLYCLNDNFAAVEGMIREKAKKATFVDK